METEAPKTEQVGPDLNRHSKYSRARLKNTGQNHLPQSGPPSTKAVFQRELLVRVLFPPQSLFSGRPGHQQKLPPSTPVTPLQDPSPSRTRLLSEPLFWRAHMALKHLHLELSLALPQTVPSQSLPSCPCRNSQQPLPDSSQEQQPPSWTLPKSPLPDLPTAPLPAPPHSPSLTLPRSNSPLMDPPPNSLPDPPPQHPPPGPLMPSPPGPPLLAPASETPSQFPWINACTQLCLHGADTAETGSLLVRGGGETRAGERLTSSLRKTTSSPRKQGHYTNTAQCWLIRDEAGASSEKRRHHSGEAGR